MNAARSSPASVPEEVDVEAVRVVLLAPDGDQRAGGLVGRDDVERGVQLVDERAVEGVHAPVQAHDARSVDPVDVHPAPCCSRLGPTVSPARGAARYRFARAHGGRHTRPVVAQFVDETNLHAKAGDGGAGAVAFRREAHVARGGPDGGDGGSGGDVWLVADHNVASLLAFRDHPFRRATDGTHGSGKSRHGRRGRGRRGAGAAEGTVVRDQRRRGARRPRRAPATATWPPRAGGAGAATPGSCPTAGGRPPSPSRARRARSTGCASSSSCWPTSPSSGSRTWGSPRSSAPSRPPSPRSPTTRSPRSSPTSASCASTTAPSTSWPTSPA